MIEPRLLRSSKDRFTVSRPYRRVNGPARPGSSVRIISRASGRPGTAGIDHGIRFSEMLHPRSATTSPDQDGRTGPDAIPTYLPAFGTR